MILKFSHIRNAAFLAVVIAVLIQLAIFFSIDNLIASAMVLSGALLGFYYAVDRQLLNEYPLSTLTIIGYTTYSFVVPPLGKLADLQSILHGLDHPIMVWVYGLMGLLTLVVAHYVYRSASFYSTIRWSITGIFYRPLHFFDMPDEFQFWLMGAIGIGATLVQYRHSSSGASSILPSFARVLSPLIYIPYFAAFPNLVDPRYKNPRRPFRLSLVAYSVVLVAVSFTTNSRTFMLIGFASLLCVYGYRIATETISPPKLTIGSMIVILGSLWLISGPITNLAASMLIARKVRTTVSPTELVRKTWGAYRNGAAVKLYGESLSGTSRSGSYSESYYSSILLNRLGNMRFTDLSIDAAQDIMDYGGGSYFRKSEFNRVIAILPTPALRLLNINIDKTQVLGGSSEDVLYTLETGAPVGGFKTGSPMVIMRMTFGMLWPICVGVLATFIFTLIDASSDVGSTWNSDHARVQCVVFNPVVAGSLFGCIFFFTGAQNVSEYLSAGTRDWISGGLLYAAVFMLTKPLSSMMFGWVRRK